MFKHVSRVPRFWNVPILYEKKPILRQVRFLDSDSTDGTKSRLKGIRKYWFFRYVDYVKNYDKVLEKNFPTTMRVYRVFSIGTKDFYEDLKNYIRMKKKQKQTGISSLTREELELDYNFPRHLIRISPILLITPIPFTNYIIFPLAFYFPHVLLTPHYWSIQEKLSFLLKEHKSRLKHNKPLLRCMQAQVKFIKDPEVKKRWKIIIGRLGSGTHPTHEDIIACKDLFSSHPYSLDQLKRNHVKELLAIHGMRQWGFWKRSKLQERGELIKRMDIAIRREGGIKRMPQDALRWALSFRGVNPVNMSTENMEHWMDQWLLVSAQVTKENISLLLHCPILLAYNHETNWTLLYHK